MYHQILSRCIKWAKSHGSCSIEFNEQGEEVRVFLLTWDRDIFRRVCVTTLDRYSSHPHHEIPALGRLPLNAQGDLTCQWFQSMADEPFSWKPSASTWGSEYCQKLNDYPSYDLRLFKRCLQWTASSMFSCLDGLAMTELIVNRLKGAETRDWM